VAEEKPRRRRSERDEDPANGKRRRPRRQGGAGAKLAERARQELEQITGLEAESVTSLARADDGSWTVTVELLELSRIPETDDLLGSYEAQLDEDGGLLGYRRVRRYARSQAIAEGEAQGG
jgi:Gas vesicle synthesis protein GvpO